MNKDDIIRPTRRVLVLGTGLQGKAALHDLAGSHAVDQVLAADKNLEDLASYISTLESDKISCRPVDANNLEDVAGLMRGVDGMIMLLPPRYGATLAPNCGGK